MNNKLKVELKKREDQFNTVFSDTLKGLTDVIQLIAPGRYSAATLEITPLVIQLIVDDVVRYKMSLDPKDYGKDACDFMRKPARRSTKRSPD